MEGILFVFLKNFLYKLKNQKRIVVVLSCRPSFKIFFKKNVEKIFGY